MEVGWPGASKDSTIHFYINSTLAKQMLFYLVCCGHYYCNSDYEVSRDRYDSYLIFYVQSGSGYIEQNNQTWKIQAGSFAFIDCYRPHRYYTTTTWEIFWIHFDGTMASAFFQRATQAGQVITPRNPYTAARCIHKICTSVPRYRQDDEITLSKLINDLLTELLLCSYATQEQTNHSDTMGEIISYISENASLQLSIEDLASRANLSKYHFLRLFKKEVGYTPHEYILLVRTHLAKYYLKKTELSLREIAMRCGFGSESSFSTSFRRQEGISPSVYRKTK